MLEASFGQQLRQFRLRAGLTQAALAERAGLATNAIAALETGARRSPYPRTVHMLTEALELSAAECAALDLASRSARASGMGRLPTPEQPTAPPRLPVWLTSFVGRRAEVGSLRRLLDPRGSAVRLLTLVGPGGVGKTRLAVAVAAELASVYVDRVVFVDLAPVRDARLVPATIARALDLRESGGRSARELVLEHLHSRQMLLLLDNFEHLLGAAPLMAELVQRCPRVAVLATSRTALHVQGERRVEVAPLTTPGTDAELLDQDLDAWPAVRLFVERALEVLPEFVLEARNGAAVAEICRRLDGVPLAIELAAARVALLSPLALLRRLEHRLPVLTSGATDLPDRQQTLRSTLAWSHALLAPADQVLFRRLAAFAGGCTLEAAEAVCADADLASDEVLDRLQGLIDASLVRRSDEPDGEPRFGMLETIREYADECLEASGEGARVRARHRAWFLARAERSPAERLSQDHIAELEHERDNLRAALRWTLTAGDTAEGLRLAGALWPLWYVRGHYTEGRGWIAELLDLPDRDGRTPGRARAIAVAGHLAYCQGDYGAAEALLQRARFTAVEAGDEQTVAVVLQFLGNLARGRSDLEHAGELYRLARELNRRLHSPVWEAMSLVGQGQTAADQGSLVDAERFASESLALCQQAGLTWGAARSLWILGRVAAGSGDYPKAQHLLQVCIASQQDIGDRQGLVWAWLDLARAAAAAGDLAKTVECLRAGLALARELGDRLSLAKAFDTIAAVATRDAPLATVRLAAAAAALRAAVGAVQTWARWAPLEAALEVARRALEPHTFEEAWASGDTLSMDRAVDQALEVLSMIRSSSDADAVVGT